MLQLFITLPLPEVLWLTDVLADWFADVLACWLSNLLTHFLTDYFSGLLTDGLIGLLIDWLNNQNRDSHMVQDLQVLKKANEFFIIHKIKGCNGVKRCVVGFYAKRCLFFNKCNWFRILAIINRTVKIMMLALRHWKEVFVTAGLSF